jgi:hypothetical protein
MSAADVLTEERFIDWHTILEANFGQNLLEPVGADEQACCALQHHLAW